MFLSRVQLNPARRGARPLLASPRSLHAAVLAAFPDPAPRPEGRVLWRLDITGPYANLFIVSPTRPDLTHLAEQAGWPSLEETQVVRPYRPLLDRIRNGHRSAFRLTANPTHSVPSESGRRGKVFGHVTVAQQEKWLLDRQQKAGFNVSSHNPENQYDSASPTFVVTDRQTLSFSRRETRVTLSTASYEGQLVVTDRDAFVHLLTHGIGRAKGYGCGLLTIAPVR